MQVPIATRRFVFIPMDLQDLSVGLLQVPNKQWGYQTVHGTNPVTYDLPIPFEEAPFTVAISTGNSGNHASCGGFTKTTIVLRAGTTAGVWDTVGFFIIGCQLQWGNLWAGYTEVLNWYFPLTTSQVYAVCLTKHTKNISSGHNWEPARIEEWNNSYARIHPDGDLGYSVIAICKAQQQWGFTNNTGRPYITFPFKFSNVFTAISCICHNGSPSEANTVYNVSISGMNIGASGGGSGKYWCAFGVAQQQWGTSVSPIIFSISFSNTMYTILQMPQSASTSAFRAEVWALERKDQDSCAFFTGSGNYSRHWIAVGF